MRYILTFILSFWAFIVNAQIVETPLIPPPVNGLKMAPLVVDGSNPVLMTPGTSGALNTEDWYITQWKNPAPLPAFNGSNRVDSPSSRIIYAPNNIEMALNSNLSTCGTEVNLFAEPNMPGGYKTGPWVPPINTGTGVNPPNTYLTGNSKIIHTLSVMPKYWAQVPFQSGCVTRNKFITAVILKNKKDWHYTLFYQLTLSQMPTNPPTSLTQNWWWKGARGGYDWGYHDTLASYGYTMPKLKETINFRADLKPRLIQIINDPNNGLPAEFKNPADWYISKTYFGPHSWGGAKSTYIATNYGLIYSRYCVNGDLNNCSN